MGYVPAMDAARLSALWREKSLRYVSAINTFVERGLRDGWANAGPEPKDDRKELAADVLTAVRAANRSGHVSSLHRDFPPAWEPFESVIEAKSQSLRPMAWIDDKRIAVRVSENILPRMAEWREPRVVIVDEDRITEQPGVRFFGLSPGSKFVALAYDDGVEVRRGWDGPRVGAFAWPDGRDLLALKDAAPDRFRPDRINQLVVFPGGQRVLLVCTQGIFVLTAAGAIRLLRNEHIERSLGGGKKSDTEFSLSMEHGAISPRGDLVLIGCQDSRHLVFNAGLELIGLVGHLSEYPNFAWFSADGELAAFSSCHMYDGMTVGVPVPALIGLDSPDYAADPPLRRLHEGTRVHAAVAREDEFVVGDAGGYLRAFDFHGKSSWQHFIGSTIQGLDLSPDKRRLAVSSYAGFLCVLELDTCTRAPFAIGTAMHREIRRWVFWRGEESVLRW